MAGSLGQADDRKFTPPYGNVNVGAVVVVFLVTGKARRDNPPPQ
jgi:hypothetical protein